MVEITLTDAGGSLNFSYGEGGFQRSEIWELAKGHAFFTAMKPAQFLSSYQVISHSAVNILPDGSRVPVQATAKEPSKKVVRIITERDWTSFQSDLDQSISVSVETRFSFHPDSSDGAMMEMRCNRKL